VRTNVPKNKKKNEKITSGGRKRKNMGTHGGGNFRVESPLASLLSKLRARRTTTERGKNWMGGRKSETRVARYLLFQKNTKILIMKDDGTKWGQTRGEGGKGGKTKWGREVRKGTTHEETLETTAKRKEKGCLVGKKKTEKKRTSNREGEARKAGESR